MRYCIFFILVFISFSTYSQQSTKREFRAAWVATVANIDWPSKPGLSVKEQKAEAIRILDTLQKNRLNAVIFQVRPASDAFYPSTLEPWSRYLTGTPGKSPGYDPLKFWIEESHKRCMEFHAWLNPFRLALKYDEPLAASHIAFEHEDWVVKYGDRLYFDPGVPETHDFIAKVVKDIVRRYDVDAIHFDDYFYPYPISGEAFPDTASFRRHHGKFTAENIDDWRRENVNSIINKLSRTIKTTKPWVKFGISPFGVWRNKSDDPKGSESTASATNYDHLYADVIKWQEEGWIDYLLPQLYWHIRHPAVDFDMLSKWWNENSFERGYYIGHAVYKLESQGAQDAWKSSDQLIDQIKLARELDNFQGSAFFSAKHLLKPINQFTRKLQTDAYKNKALIPVMPWIDGQSPDAPTNIKKSGKTIKWEKPFATDHLNEAVRYVVYKTPTGELFDPQNSEYIEEITSAQKIKMKRSKGQKRNYAIRVSALDRLHNESKTTKPIVIKL